MIEAVVGDVVVARSEETVVVEGNHYFPLASVLEGVLHPSSSSSLCPWKGRASYFTVVADGVELDDAAWTYPKPWPLARRIKGRVAFYPTVEVRRAG